MTMVSVLCIPYHCLFSGLYPLTLPGNYYLRGRHNQFIIRSYSKSDSRR